MTPSPRYCAIDNHVLERTGGSIPLSVPGVERRFPSILFESLASSVQSHVQIPSADAFPRYDNTAVRTLGPVLALATNSDEIFEFARRGLRERGVPSETVEEYPAPIEARWTERTTPSRRKLVRVADRLDAGVGFGEAIREMQTEYVRRSGTGAPIVAWS